MVKVVAQLSRDEDDLLLPIIGDKIGLDGLRWEHTYKDGYMTLTILDLTEETAERVCSTLDGLGIKFDRRAR